MYDLELQLLSDEFRTEPQQWTRTDYGPCYLKFQGESPNTIIDGVFLLVFKPEVMKWLRENCVHRFGIKTTQKFSMLGDRPETVMIWFENFPEYVHFKMKWT